MGRRKAPNHDSEKATSIRCFPPTLERFNKLPGWERGMSADVMQNRIMDVYVASLKGGKAMAKVLNNLEIEAEPVTIITPVTPVMQAPVIVADGGTGIAVPVPVVAKAAMLPKLDDRLYNAELPADWAPLARGNRLTDKPIRISEPDIVLKIRKVYSVEDLLAKGTSVDAACGRVYGEGTKRTVFYDALDKLVELGRYAPHKQYLNRQRQLGKYDAWLDGMKKRFFRFRYTRKDEEEFIGSLPRNGNVYPVLQ